MSALSGHTASSSSKPVWCFRSKLRNLANNLIASHLHRAHSEKCFIVGWGAHRWQHSICLQAVTSLVVLKRGAFTGWCLLRSMALKSLFPNRIWYNGEKRNSICTYNDGSEALMLFSGTHTCLVDTWAQQPVDIVLSVWSPLPGSCGEDWKQSAIPFCSLSVSPWMPTSTHSPVTAAVELKPARLWLKLGTNLASHWGCKT